MHFCVWLYKPFSLHYPLERLHGYLTPTQDELNMRLCAYSRVRSLLNWIYPNCKIYLYGSVASGLFLPSSDLDIAVDYSHGRPDMFFIADILRHESDDYAHTHACK